MWPTVLKAPSPPEVKRIDRPRSRFPFPYWPDIAIGLGFFTLGLLLSLWIGVRWMKLGTQGLGNYWFQADVDQVFTSMTTLLGHERTQRHPLQSLLTTPFVYVLHALGFSKTTAVAIVLATAAGVWTGSTYAAGRLLALPRGVAVAAASLATASAGGLFWFATPESYVMGGASMMVAFCVFAAFSVRRAAVPEWAAIGANVVSLSITTTNWMVGVFGSFIYLRRKRAVQVVANGLLLTTLLWAVQAKLLPGCQYFLKQNEWDKNYWLRESAGTAWDKADVILADSIVIPSPQEVPFVNHPDLSIQRTPLVDTADVRGSALRLVWLAFLGAGVVTALRQRPLDPSLRLLLLVVGGQLALHLVYGDETFLYAAHWTGFLVLLAAQAWRILGARATALAMLTLAAGAAVVNVPYLQASFDAMARFSQLK